MLQHQLNKYLIDNRALKQTNQCPNQKRKKKRITEKPEIKIHDLSYAHHQSVFNNHTPHQEKLTLSNCSVH